MNDSARRQSTAAPAATRKPAALRSKHVNGAPPRTRSPPVLRFRALMRAQWVFLGFFIERRYFGACGDHHHARGLVASGPADRAVSESHSDGDDQRIISRGERETLAQNRRRAHEEQLSGVETMITSVERGRRRTVSIPATFEVRSGRRQGEFSEQPCSAPGGGGSRCRSSAPQRRDRCRTFNDICW